MTIARIAVWTPSYPFRDGPYAMSHVVQTSVDVRLFAVTTDDGRAGVGEAVAAPSVPAEARAPVLERETDDLARLIGKPETALLDLARDLRALGKPGAGQAFGIETAWYDLEARRQGVAVCDVIGGAMAESVPDYFSISEKTPERVRARVAEGGPERAVFQLKLGVGDFDDDVLLLGACLRAMKPDQTVLADANGGWSVDRACETIAAFDDERIVWEEPCPDYDENLAVMARSGVRVQVDQCAASAAVARRAATDGLVHSICIKPAFLGGLSVAREIRELCAENGVAMRIDGPWCGDVASAAILHLAVGAPPDLLVAGCDLREPLVIESGLGGVRHLPGFRIAPPEGVGLGIEGVAETFGPPDVVYG